MSREFLEKYHFNPEEFERLRSLYCAGQLSLKSNVINHQSSWQVRPPRPEDSADLPGDDSEEYHKGRRLLREGRCAMILMNGGTATRFQEVGEETPKGAFEIMEIAGRPRSFMEIKLAHARWAEAEHGGGIPVWVLNSYFTDEKTRAILQANRSYGKESVFTYCQGIMKRLIPMEGDLDLHYGCEMKKLKEAAASSSGPARETKEQELRELEERLREWRAVSRGHGGEVFSARKPKDSYNPPGHLDATLFLILDPSRPLLRMIEMGIRYLNISNIDNLGATIHPGLFGLLEARGKRVKILCEVSEKPPGQKGGALARVFDPDTGREWTQLIEEFAFPPDFNQNRIPEFNNATYTIALKTLLKLFELDASLLKKLTQEELRERVGRVTSRLPVYAAMKEIKEKAGEKEVVHPVIQFERLQGDITRLAPPLGVKTTDRFFPVKKREDIPAAVPRLRRVLEGKLILQD